MKKRNPPNPAKGCASELYDLQSNRREKGGVVRAGEKVRLNYEKKIYKIKIKNNTSIAAETRRSCRNVTAICEPL